jgi:drug/metabolite transporter (DMT)-like permease
MSSSRLKIAAAFAVIYLLWGGTYLAIALALPSIPPFLLMGSRSVAGGGLLLATAWFGGRAIDAGTAVRAAICGLLLFVGCHGALAYAQQRVPSGLAAVLLASIPFWIVMVGALMPGGQRPGLKQLGLLAVGLVGVAFVVMGRGSDTRGGTSYADISLLVAAAFSWAVGTTLSERWSPKDREIAFSGIALLAGGAVLVLMSTWRGELTSFAIDHVSGTAVAAWIYLTAAGTVLAFVAYVWLLKQVTPALAATYTFVNPVIALLLGWAVLGEQIGLTMALGALLVVASVGGLLVTRRTSSCAGRQPVCFKDKPRRMGPGARPGRQ